MRFISRAPVCILALTIPSAIALAGLARAADAAPAPAVASTQAGIVLPVGNDAVFYSPYNWQSDGSGKMTPRGIHGPASGEGSSTWIQTTCAGAYFKVIFSGTRIALRVDTSPLMDGKVTPNVYPMLRYFIDGIPFPDLQEPATGGAMELATGLKAGTHHLTCYLLRTLQGNDRWGQPGVSPHDVFRFNGFELDPGAALAPHPLLPKRAVYFGDSITEGVRSLNMDHNFTGTDGVNTAAQLLCQSLDCEAGIVGYGAQAWTGGGSGGVPGFLTAWNFQANGVPRDFTPAPDYVISNEGANGGASAANTQAWIEDVRKRLGDGPMIVCIAAFNGGRGADISAYKLAHPADKKVFSVDGAAANHGLLADKRYALDNLHPLNAGHAVLAVRLSAMLQAEIDRAAQASDIVKDGK